MQRKVGFRINEDKTKAMMKAKKRAPPRQNIAIGENSCENVDNPPYPKR